MNCTQELDALLLQARQNASRRRQLFCEAEQVLETLLRHGGRKAAAAPLTEYLEKCPRLTFELPSVELARTVTTRILPQAIRVCREEGEDAIGVAQLTTVLLGDNSPIPHGLREAVSQRLNVSSAVNKSRHSREATSINSGPSRETAKIEKFLRPFSTSANSSLVPRSALLDRILLILTFGNPLIVGPVGSGRRSLVDLLASCLSSSACPPPLRGLRMVSLDLTALVAGTSYRGELEERVAQLIAYLASKPERQILVVRELRLLACGDSSSNGTGIASALLPALQERQFTLLGCATHDEVREDLEKSPGLLSLLSPVQLDSATDAEARELLSTHVGTLAHKFSVAFADDAVNESVSLCVHHLPHLALPGAAARLLEHAAAVLGFESMMLTHDPGRAGSLYWKIAGDSPTRTSQLPLLTKRHLLHSLSAQHRIPIEHLEGGASTRVREFEAKYRARIFGQDHVLPVLRNTAEIALKGLSDPGRPRGVMFFLGPPGTGKTETAKVLAQILMGSEDAVLRFDMSEFQDRSSVSTLIGSDKGLVGSNEGGRLTEPLRINPHRVILFDEIEKADPSIYNLFLQILGDGKIHDKRGYLISFRHSLIIFTSNAGCDGRQDMAGLDRREILSRLQGIFRPEFLDRIEKFIPFHAIGKAARVAVANYQLTKLSDLLSREHHLTLKWSADVVSNVSERPETEPGVRDILRWIQSEVKPVVARVLPDCVQSNSNDLIRLALDESGQLTATRELASLPHAIDNIEGVPCLAN